MEWISCLDRLPQTSVMVLGWVAKAQMCKVVVLRFESWPKAHKDEEWVGDEVEGEEGTLTEYLPLDRISHWAHLPNPPGV
jgi:hypothetical protein